MLHSITVHAQLLLKQILKLQSFDFCIKVVINFFKVGTRSLGPLVGLHYLDLGQF